MASTTAHVSRINTPWAQALFVPAHTNRRMQPVPSTSMYATWVAGILIRPCGWAAFHARGRPLHVGRLCGGLAQRRAPYKAWVQRPVPVRRFSLPMKSPRLPAAWPFVTAETIQLTHTPSSDELTTTAMSCSSGGSSSSSPRPPEGMAAASASDGVTCGATVRVLHADAGPVLAQVPQSWWAS